MNYQYMTLGLVPAALLLSSCVPLIVAGGSVATVTTAAKDKGISGSMGDTQISTSIKAKLYQKDQDIHRRVGVNVQNGEVLLTGSLATQALIDEVEQIVWSIPGVTKVMNEMGVNSDDSLGFSEATTDSWITTQVKSSLVFTADIKSINYSIKTVSGVVYIMGTAQNQAELDKVMEIARKTRGVKKVMSYVKVCENLGASEPNEHSSDAVTDNEDTKGIPSTPPSKESAKDTDDMPAEEEAPAE
ncbi:MAG: BON domain-containing protein [Alphaproteobacteria bacterium]|nr:BON domain-containing protein [Alphaproteobacteria bacterium]